MTALARGSLSNPLLRPLEEKLVLTRDFLHQALKILKHKLNVQDFQWAIGKKKTDIL